MSGRRPNCCLFAFRLTSWIHCPIWSVFIHRLRKLITAVEGHYPQHDLAGKLTPPLLPRGISIEGEDEITHPSDPIPPPALHTKDRHHTRHARCQERQR